MFTPEKPDPYRYHKPAAKKPARKPDDGALTTIILQLTVVAVLIAAIVAIIYSSPKENPLVCDKTIRQRSLTSFGTCHREPSSSKGLRF